MTPEPSNHELLRAIYRRLDRETLLRDHPTLTKEKLDAFFKRVASILGEEKGSIQGAIQSGKVILHCDGGSRGNPGPAGCGIVLLDASSKVLLERSFFLRLATSNEAEYSALIGGLEDALQMGVQEIVIRLDSQLLVRQMNGEYKVKSRNLKPLFSEVRRLLERFSSWRSEHIPRERNVRADELANEAMDRGSD